MPQYEFLCHACKHEFPKILTLAEYEDYEDRTANEKIICPKCGSMDVEQAWAAFYAVTTKKS